MMIRNRRQKRCTVVVRQQQQQHLLLMLLLLCYIISCIQFTTTIYVAAAESQHIPSGLQTGPDRSGSSFASSVTYDTRTNSIIIAGSTFGQYFSTMSTTTTDTSITTTPRLTSNCFVATIVLPDDDDDDSNNRKLEWSTKQVLGATEEDKVQEACSMALYHPQNNNKLIALGFSEVGGKFDPLYDDASVNPIQHYGFLLDIDIITSSSSSSSTTAPYRINGGRAIQEYSVSYPIMVSIQNEYIYVVSQETDTMTRTQDGNMNNQFVDDSTNITYDINNEVDPMRYFKYGDKYGMSIRKYRSYPQTTSAEDNTDTFKILFGEEWDINVFAKSITFSSSSGRNITTTQSAHVSGITMINNEILVTAGSTTGDGTAFGRGNTDDSTMYNDDSLHGFVTKFFQSNGTVLPDVKDDKGNVQNKGTRRIQSSAEGGRVWVAGICNHITKEPDALYIVGAVEGLIKTSDSSKFASGSSSDNDSGVDAYIMKIDVNTLEEIWIRQIAGSDSGSMVRGISCAVATNDDAIWLSGVVQDDGVVKDADTMSSYGGDDIFVTKINSKTGEHLFTRQIGSIEDDGLAMRGGITLDRNDNCIVVGNTYGSMYRVRTDEEVSDNDDDDNRIWISDVFVTTIRGSDGTISYPISHPDYVPQPGSGSAGEDVDVSVPPAIEKSSSGSQKSTTLIVLLVFLICGSVAVALYMRNRSKLNRDASTDRSKVIQFLNEFDVDDIDLKHSATGGWHCSYSNDLALGHNRRASEQQKQQQRSPAFGVLSPLPSDRSKRPTLGSDPLLTAPLTRSSIVKDSLFMNDDDDDDDDSRSSFGGSKRFTESTATKQRPGYGGLLDEYNAGWNDRQSDDRESNDTWGKEIL